MEVDTYGFGGRGSDGFNPLISGMGNGSKDYNYAGATLEPLVSIRLSAAWGMEDTLPGDLNMDGTEGFNPLISGMGNGSHKHAIAYCAAHKHVSIRLSAAWGMEEAFAGVREDFDARWVSIRLSAARGMEVTKAAASIWYVMFQSAYQRHGEWKLTTIRSQQEQLYKFQSAYQRHGEWKTPNVHTRQK